MATESTTSAFTLDRLVIENLFCYAEAEVQFTDELTAIAGPNGSGKSSLLEALFFALYGSKAATVMGRTLDGVLRDGADQGYVELAFTYGDRPYTARMGLKRQREQIVSHNCRLDTPEETIEGVQAMTQAIGDLIGLSAEDFTNAVYVRQGDIDRITRAKPEDRAGMMDRLLRLSDLDSYAERATSARRAVNRTRDQVKGKWEAADKRARTDEDPHQARDEWDERINNLTEQRDELGETLESITERGRVLRNAQMAQQEVERKQKELGDLQEQQRELKETIEGLKAALADAPEHIDDRLGAIPNEISDTRDLAQAAIDGIRIDTARDKVKSVEAQIESLDKTLNHKRDLIEKGQCPECGQPIHEGTFEDALGKDEAERQRLVNERQAAQAEVQKLDERRKAIEQERDRRIKALEAEADQLRDWQRKRDKLANDQKLHQDKDERIKKLETEIAEAPEYDADELARLENRARDLSRQRDNLQSELDNAKHARGQAAERARTLDNAIEERDQLKVRLDELEKTAADVDHCAAYYAEAKRRLRATKVQAIAEQANRLFARMSTSYAGVRLSEACELALVTHDGTDVPPAQLSGGERGMLNLALRGAIHQVISASTLRLPLVLDEPTTHLDAERVGQVRELMEALSGQIVLVTHEESLLHAADRQLWTEKRADNTSTVHT